MSLFSGELLCIALFECLSKRSDTALAYAYKKSVVATRLVSFCEVVLENQSGFLCEPNNVESLAEALEKMILARDHIGEMGEVGYEYVKNAFLWDEIAKEVSALYESS